MLRRLEAHFSKSRSKMATDVIDPVSPTAAADAGGRTSRPRKSDSAATTRPTKSPLYSSSSATAAATSDIPTTSFNFSSGGPSPSSFASISTLRKSLPEKPHLYGVSEIRATTNNFLSKHFSPSSWRCSLRGQNVVVFQRKLHHPTTSDSIKMKLSSLGRSHHIAIVKLLGVSIADEYIYLVYEHVPGSSLSDCLRNPNNPNFTVLSTWMSRIQIATDVANGLDYIHNNTGLNIVHNHIKSSSIVITEPSFNAKICHFGTAELCGERTEERESHLGNENSDEIKEESPPEKLTKSNSIKFKGTRGYMSPEFESSGIGTRKSDVFSFGVVILELLSGEEPVKYKFDKATGDYVRLSVVEAARAAVDGGEGWLRRWVDRRLRDSFPIDVVEKMTRLALDCVHVDPNQRPDTRRVAGKISKMYLESGIWCEKLRIPTDITTSFAPR